MTIDLKITLNPADMAHAEEVIGRLTSEISQPVRLLGVIGEALLDTTRQRFQDQEDPAGAKWKSLSALTLALRSGTSILRRSGRLYGSLHYNVAGNKLELGPAPLPYARIHQADGIILPKNGKALAIPFKAGFKGAGGAKANKPGVIFLAKVTIPARPYIGFGAKDETAVREGVASWLGAF